MLKLLHGPDNLPASLLKDASEELAVPFCMLINLSFRNGIFPTVEKCGKVLVIPIYKSEDRTSFDNYRPISLLNSIAEVIEKIAYMSKLQIILKKMNYYAHNNLALDAENVPNMPLHILMNTFDKTWIKADLLERYTWI